MVKTRNTHIKSVELKQKTDGQFKMKPILIEPPAKHQIRSSPVPQNKQSSQSYSRFSSQKKTNLEKNNNEDLEIIQKFKHNKPTT